MGTKATKRNFHCILANSLIRNNEHTTIEEVVAIGQTMRSVYS